MVKIYLVLAFLIVLTFSTSAQTDQQHSDAPRTVAGNIKNEQHPEMDHQPSPATELQKAAVDKASRETKPEVKASTETKPEMSVIETVVKEKPAPIPEVKPEVKKSPSASPVKTQDTLPSIPKKATLPRDQTTGNPQIDLYIADACEKYGVDPLLIVAQMQQESSYNRRAVSKKGASGLMQLMPDTAQRFGVKNTYNPKQNIEAGVKYMQWLLKKFGGDVSLALAGYNAGEGSVIKYGNRIPPYRETKDYVKRITARYAEISEPDSDAVAVVGDVPNSPK
jgi:flagellum-specific peptidoglycan hydrolase FlgJ